MPLDPTLVQLLFRRKQMISRSNTCRNTLLQGAALLFAKNDDKQCNRNSHGGSKKGNMANCPCDFEGSYQQLFQQYLSPRPLCNEPIFRFHFQMSRQIFFKISEAIKNYSLYFTHRPDALGRWGLKPMVKITAVFWMLAYGGTAD